MSEEKCGDDSGTTVGLPPNTATIYCELPKGHESQHWGTASIWYETWGDATKYAPGTNR